LDQSFTFHPLIIEQLRINLPNSEFSLIGAKRCSENNDWHPTTAIRLKRTDLQEAGFLVIE